MEKIAGLNLQLMDDELIKQKLEGKNVTIIMGKNAEEGTEIDGLVTECYCYSINQSPVNKKNNIAGIRIQKVEDITFSDDMIICINE